MNWNQAVAGVSRHQKTAHLSELMGLTIRDTVGLLFMFWGMISEQYETGNISLLRVNHLNKSVNYRVKSGSKRGTTRELPVKLAPLEALIAAGFIDPPCAENDNQLTVHNWIMRNGKYLRDRERHAADREAKKESADGARTGRGQGADDLPSKYAVQALHTDKQQQSKNGVGGVVKRPTKNGRGDGVELGLDD